jgi:hypothetical protein
MEILIKEGNLTVSHKLGSEWPNEITAEQALLAAYDVIGRIFGQKAVIKAYHRTNPDSMDMRDEDDDLPEHDRDK